MLLPRVAALAVLWFMAMAGMALAEANPPVTYRLDAADIEALSAVQAAPRGPAPVGAPPKVESGAFVQPTPAQLGDMLRPLLDVDYPIEDHFRRVLGLAHCAYAQQVGKIDKASGKVVTLEEACPAPPATPGARSASAPPPQAAEQTAPRGTMLPSDLAERIVQQARKPHPPDPRFDASWSATPGCGCVQATRGDEVYGFVSYWGTTEQQQASPLRVAGGSAPRPSAARQIDFSLFSRLSFFGAMLNDRGDFDLPAEVSAQGLRLARQARRHGTAVDLVVHRNEWGRILERPSEELARFATRAAVGAMKLVDAREANAPEVARALLLPFWSEEASGYSGITVFFDNAPADGTAAAVSYRIFRDTFVDGLVRAMRASGRRYRLNLVVPDHRLAEEGLHAFQDMQSLIEATEPPRTSKKVDAAEKARYRGSTDITVNYIVLMSDPVSRTKKALRESLDRSETVRGTRRVALLESMVPTLLRPSSSQPPWAPSVPIDQFGDDLAYLKWTYGGVALWELPGDGPATRGA